MFGYLSTYSLVIKWAVVWVRKDEEVSYENWLEEYLHWYHYIMTIELQLSADDDGLVEALMMHSFNFLHCSAQLPKPRMDGRFRNSVQINKLVMIMT